MIAAISVLAGTRSCDLGDVLDFPHISASISADSVPFCFTIALGRTHFLQGGFSVAPYTLANPFGSHA